ncbi:MULTISPECIES: formate dehydrogenase subunit delta [Pseudomonas]|jgi:formate dehydrogenase subunit delta|uniref:formate dehydrogenase subunit delta n=1 Tax=Pseudomonas TaxID=286 RepID=UPI00034CEA5A|nr:MULTISPECIES: formate dehydrogenase subunit delta [Pseudomonas]MBJ2348190.1 formate dehydrogenase subunit delta [Pseudomonas canavaninivorans]MBL3544756.1 formate dehydrogenase subunit delta [Pseudomonas sp. HB05]UVM75128.1 formate dehydrogenase subunit delta [Pseudomonas canavaninivorans]
MSSQNLIKMANEIARYFATEPDQALAVNGIRQHIKNFWTPGMRRDLGAWQEKHPDAVLHPLVLAALKEPEGAT